MVTVRYYCRGELSTKVERTIIRMKLRQEKIMADYPDITGNSTGPSKVGALLAECSGHYYLYPFFLRSLVFPNKVWDYV